MESIPLADLHAIEETIRYIEDYPTANYDDLIKHLSWYWERDKPWHPKEWVLDWIKCLVGEYDFEDFSIRRGIAIRSVHRL